MQPSQAAQAVAPPQPSQADLQELQRLVEEAGRLGAAGRNEEALAVSERMAAQVEKMFGPDSTQLALILDNLGDVYSNLGLYTKAEPHYLRALAIREKVLGPDHLDTAQSVNSLGLLYFNEGEYAKAEPLYRRVLAVETEKAGPESHSVATVLNNLGELYRATGDYAQAESLYLQSIAIEEKASGPEAKELIQAVTNLGALYYLKGDFGRAESLFRRSLAIVEKTKGADAPEAALVLNNLGALYHSMGDAKRSEDAYRRALDITEKSYGPDHVEVALELNNLGELYRELEQYERAAPLYERALAIREKTLGPDHPDTAELVDNMALLAQARGDYARAEALQARALATLEKVYGPNHPKVATTLSNISALYLAKGDAARAVEFDERAEEINEHNLALVLSTGSEQQKQLFLNTLTGQTQAAVSLNVRAAPDDPRAARFALTTILRRKGRSLDAMADEVGALRRRASAEDRALLERLAAARSALAALQLSPDQAALAPAERQAREAQLSSEVERLEAEVSRRSAAFRAASRPVTYDAVRAAIPPDAALVEIFSYRPFDPKKELEKFAAPRYVAYVVRRDSASPQFADLGDAAEIDADAARLRAALKDPRRRDVERLARALDERAMRPIRKLLGETHRVFLSPDGALNLVPFAALVDESGKYLVETYSITYLTSGRDLLRLQVRAEANSGPPFVFADPAFDLAATTNAPPPATTDASLPATTTTARAATRPTLGGANRRDVDKARGLRSSDLSQVVWPRLKGTAGEAEALRATLAGAQVLTGASATEAALKQMRRPRLLHVATHGFFLPDQPEGSSDGTRGMKLSVGASPSSSSQAARENPLLRSGLVLAGVNHQQSGAGEDGVLTALEAAGLDLWGTRLVVLSACETGLGDVRNGEGVYGLRRALVLAGSETQVMSLWQVSDAGTRDLMTAYYRLLQAGASRTEALRQVQLSMLRGEDLSAVGGRRGLDMGGDSPKARMSHPYFWAAFIPSGAWTNMDGEEARGR
ncbi:MAG TPA: CHAT domain-containing tetratricopeptide repeat protein [Pyrinomonadaceae bacterium]|nr:CHAT domain-containing tetratricopeptide repeat protein [Pyrinomonadaceae bacterium]